MPLALQGLPISMVLARDMPARRKRRRNPTRSPRRKIFIDKMGGLLELGRTHVFACLHRLHRPGEFTRVNRPDKKGGEIGKGNPIRYCRLR